VLAHFLSYAFVLLLVLVLLEPYGRRLRLQLPLPRSRVAALLARNLHLQVRSILLLLLTRHLLLLLYRDGLGTDTWNDAAHRRRHALYVV
tara:strand:- start:85 stop:354 length:270 start_codon:yes stop_codon:yes gene_type:complete